MNKPKKFDVVVVGAGSAGSAAAWMLSKAGFSVALVEARPLGETGARWSNGVPAWMFERAGVEAPLPPEVCFPEGPFTILGKTGAYRIILEKSPVLAVDMRLLVSRLQDLAKAAGVEVFERTRLETLEFEGERPVLLKAAGPSEKGGKRSLTFRAKLFVDASGMAGALRRQVPALDAACPPVAAKDTCSAAQEICSIAESAGARNFLETNGGRLGETLSWAGIDGGFSALNVAVDTACARVSLLCGTIADGTHTSGPEHLLALKQRESWIGERLFGGAGLVPLRRPYERLSAAGVALIGDAACQVYAAHGSGTGFGLIAARMLADALAGKSDPGAPESTWAYQAAFLREFGGTLAASDAFRRASQSLTEAEVEELIRSGLMQPELAHAGLLHQIPKPMELDLLGLTKGFFEAPRLVAKLLPCTARMGAALALYRGHPEEPDPGQYNRWAGRVKRLFGDP